MRELRDRVAVVTGGASGIGKGIARCLVARGMHVVLADIEADALSAAAEEVGATGIQTDVTSASSVQALANQTVEQFGDVHLLCNNAGIGPFAPLADMTSADWQWILNVNLWGVIHGIQTFLPLLRRHGEESHIVNTASIGGLEPVPGLGAYCASKAAVVALSETLSLELSETAIGVTVFCPGPIHSRLGSSLRNRPRSLNGSRLADVAIEDMQVPEQLRWKSADDAGRIVVRAVEEKALYAFTHPEMFKSIATRFDAITKANAAVLE